MRVRVRGIRILFPGRLTLQPRAPVSRAICNLRASERSSHENAKSRSVRETYSARYLTTRPYTSTRVSARRIVALLRERNEGKPRGENLRKTSRIPLSELYSLPSCHKQREHYAAIHVIAQVIKLIGKGASVSHRGRSLNDLSLAQDTLLPAFVYSLFLRYMDSRSGD